MKIIPAHHLKADNILALLKREIEMLKQLKGDYIVNVRDLKRTANNIYIFLEFKLN